MSKIHWPHVSLVIGISLSLLVGIKFLKGVGEMRRTRVLTRSGQS